MTQARLTHRTTVAFNRCFFVFYLILFILTFIGGMISVAVFGELGTEAGMPAGIIILRFLAMLIAFAGLTAGFVLMCRLLMSGRTAMLDSRRLNTGIIFIGVGIMLAIQLVWAFNLQMTPITDIKNLDRYARQIVADNSFTCVDSPLNSYYIVRYQNNVPILFLYTFVYKICYMLTGGVSHAPLIVLNTLSINGAVLLTVLTSRRLFGERKALFTLALCALFMPYYTYTPYFYTDSFSIPFVAGTICTLVIAAQSKGRAKKMCFLLLSGAICFIGFKLKASVIILLPALLIYLALSVGIKRAAKVAAVWLLSFCVLLGAFNIGLNTSGIISKESSDRYQFPPEHWIMMGLKDYGAFNYPDSDFSKSFNTKAERREGNIEEIQKRIAEKGVPGMAVHLGQKAVWTYMDGTYYIANYLEHHENDSPLHELVLYDGSLRFPFFVYSFGYQMFLMAMISLSALYAARRKSVGATTLLRIAIFGMVLFFLIWETNARYPFNFTPLYMLLATEGAFGLCRKRSILLHNHAKKP